MKTIYINIILTLCALVLMVIPLFGEIRKKNKTKNFFKNITNLGWFFIIILLITLGFGIFKEYINKNEENDKEIRLQNPIPETLGITFSSSIELSKKEIVQIGNRIKSTSSIRDNLLPFDSDQTIDGFEKINSFKNIMFQLNISFHNDGKIMTIIFNRVPLNIFGYNTINSTDSFMLSFQDDKSVLMLDGFLLETDNITTNYKSPSLLDFENSKVLISYEFFFPELMHYGSLPPFYRYKSKNPNYLLLNFIFLSLTQKNYTINITNLKRIEPHKFEGNWTVEKK
ncbi:MAG: hypothetical protein NTX93_01575 [Bacteroidia bacterium]|nr:hypothetical protein [Bacteroidia bacterium]